jgi:hypothetical protein
MLIANGLATHYDRGLIARSRIIGGFTITGGLLSCLSSDVWSSAAAMTREPGSHPGTWIKIGILRSDQSAIWT